MSHMKRREFITLLGGTAVAWPLAAWAQQGERMQRLGVLMNSAESDSTGQSYVGAFAQALRKLGWVDGKNLHIDWRWRAGGADQARAYAAELVGLAPDVILSSSTMNLAALQRVTRTIPIVFVQVSDPVAQGFVSSLARPGGNITGFSGFEFSIGGKWVDLLKQIDPALFRVAVIFNPETSDSADAKSAGWEATGVHACSFNNLVSANENCFRQGEPQESRRVAAQLLRSPSFSRSWATRWGAVWRPNAPQQESAAIQSPRRRGRGASLAQ
jgi:hypothetical protein